MRTKTRRLVFLGLALAVLAGGAFIAYRYRAPNLERSLAHVSTFEKESPRLAAKALIERYGAPDALSPDTATWYERGPWKRITVHGDAPLSFLEQVVSYHVPAEAAAPLLELDHGLRFDLAREELSATSNSESLNFLALNLAHEVSSARRGAAEARELYARTARLAASGKSSPYLEKLQFEPYRREPLEPWGGRTP